MVRCTQIPMSMGQFLNKWKMLLRLEENVAETFTERFSGDRGPTYPVQMWVNPLGLHHAHAFSTLHVEWVLFSIHHDNPVYMYPVQRVLVIASQC